MKFERNVESISIAAMATDKMATDKMATDTMATDTMAISIDEWIQDQLSYLDNYYIKGGKAFCFYFGCIPTVDTDLVMVEKECDTLFRNATLCWSGKHIQVNEFIFEVTHIKENKQTYKDKINGIMRKQTVRTLLFNGITIFDAIIVDSIQPEEIYMSDRGVYYMEKNIFMKDMIETYQDRIKKCLYFTMENEKTRLFREKVERAKQRAWLIVQSGFVC